MTDLNLSDLKAIAEEAMPKVTPPCGWMEQSGRAYLKGFDPPTALALIARIDHLTTALRYYADGGNPTDEFPVKEFGCECCARMQKRDEQGNWEVDWEAYENVPGWVARKVLNPVKTPSSQPKPG